MEMKKYVDKCINELLITNPELMLDTTFLQRLEKQLLLSKPRVMLENLKAEDMRRLHDIDDETPLSVLAQTSKRTAMRAESPPHLMQDIENDSDKLVVEIQPSTNENPLTYKISIPSPHFINKGLRFEFKLSSVFDVPPTIEKCVSKKRQNVETKAKPIEPPTEENLSSMIENILGEENVANPNAAIGAPKKRRGRKKNTTNKKETDKSDLARFVEDFSCDCNQTRSTSSTPKVSSTTQNTLGANGCEYNELNGFDIVNYINDGDNQAYNVVAKPNTNCFAQDVAMRSDIVYLPDVGLESNIQYALQPLEGDQQILVCVPQLWNEKCSHEEQTNVLDKFNTDVNENYINEDESYKAALDMPTLDDMDTFEPNNDNVGSAGTKEKETEQCADPLDTTMKDIQGPDLFEDAQPTNSNLLEKSVNESCDNTNIIDLDENIDISHITLEMPAPIKIEEFKEFLGYLSEPSTTENDIQTITTAVRNDENESNNKTVDAFDNENKNTTSVVGGENESTSINEIDTDYDADTLELDIEHSVLDWEQRLFNEVDFEETKSTVSGNDCENIAMELNGVVSEESKSSGNECKNIAARAMETPQKVEKPKDKFDENLHNSSTPAQLTYPPVFSACTLFKAPYSLRNALQLLTPDELYIAYRYLFNHKPLFMKYFHMFCEMYGVQKNRNQLFSMVDNCGCYIGCGHLLQPIFIALVQCGFSKVNACRHILKRTNYRLHDTIDNLVSIIMQADWTMFHDDLLRFAQVNNYKYRCATVEQMLPTVMVTRNSQLHVTFLSCLFYMTPEETYRLSAESKHFIAVLAHRKNSAENIHMNI